MAAYISVPRDFSKVKSKVAFNLTVRQLVCFGAAAVVGVPLFFVLRDTVGNTGATLGMMAVMLPMFFLAMYQKNGQPAEKILRYYFQVRFVRPKVRPYQTRNYYALLMSYAKVLGATSRQDGYLEGNGYLVSWCVGHLVELAPPNVYDAKYVKWSIADLPILPQKWQYLVSTSTKKQFGILQKLMHRPDVDSIVNSCDAG